MLYDACMVTKEIIQQVPKVELHDHLDGGLRIQTILELAKEQHVELPSNDPQKLHDWFVRGCKQKSLTLYLEPFGVTTQVMQTQQALERVAFEAVEDLAREHVCYAEIRFAPILHVNKGLSLEQVVQAVLDGLQRGTRQTGMPTGLILCAMRNQSPSISHTIAELAVAFADRGVVGFDLAGDEIGYPPKKHLEAFQFIRNKNFNITIHAGEAFGVESIWQAVQLCGAHRIGHGVRLVEDMGLEGSRIDEMGSLANFILDRRIPMEMCLTSNVGTGAAKDYASHPFPILFRNKFRVFLCSDNRLMSDTNLTREMELAVQYYNLNIRDLEKITINAMKSAFIHHDQKLSIIYDVIKKGYLAIREQYGITDY
ncbi:Adenosine deaminase [bioreactor metagenome]|jgi:adenosine deaminase|uniref:adenosine deaminase n=2 Tax=root TaxID=1 RepID=A0A644W0P9_9ZZZZ|nr:adenosine deaminase [Spirochaetales bacterium]